MKNNWIKINITQNDINKGVKGDCSHCPIARALYRHIKKFKGVREIQVSTGFHFSEKKYKMIGENFDWERSGGTAVFTISFFYLLIANIIFWTVIV